MKALKNLKMFSIGCGPDYNRSYQQHIQFPNSILNWTMSVNRYTSNDPTQPFGVTLGVELILIGPVQVYNYTSTDLIIWIIYWLIHGTVFKVRRLKKAYNINAIVTWNLTEEEKNIYKYIIKIVRALHTDFKNFATLRAFLLSVTQSLVRGR
jgi:hypothetical protein